jgi:hypothetical protein
MDKKTDFGSISDSVRTVSGNPEFPNRHTSDRGRPKMVRRPEPLDVAECCTIDVHRTSKDVYSTRCSDRKYTSCSLRS